MNTEKIKPIPKQILGTPTKTWRIYFVKDGKKWMADCTSTSIEFAVMKLESVHGHVDIYKIKEVDVDYPYQEDSNTSQTDKEIV